MDDVESVKSIILLKRYHDNLPKKKIQPTIYIFMHFLIKKKKVIVRGYESVPLATPEGLANTWNNCRGPIHYHAIETLWIIQEIGQT